MPRAVVESSPHFEPSMRGAPVRRWISVAGLDVVRAPDGRFMVLEDQVRMPAGSAYAVAARETLRELLPVSPPQADHSAVLRRARAGAPRRRSGGRGRAERRAALRGPRRRGVVGARAARPRAVRPRGHARRPRACATAAWWPGSTGARAPWTWSTTAPTRTASAARALGAALLGPCRAGTLACVNAHRLGRGRRQAGARLRGGDGPLLPRRGAAPAVGGLPPARRPGVRDRPRGARGQAARRDGRRGRGDLARRGRRATRDAGARAHRARSRARSWPRSW